MKLKTAVPGLVLLNLSLLVLTWTIFNPPVIKNFKPAIRFLENVYRDGRNLGEAILKLGLQQEYAEFVSEEALINGLLTSQETAIWNMSSIWTNTSSSFPSVVHRPFKDVGIEYPLKYNKQFIKTPYPQPAGKRLPLSWFSNSTNSLSPVSFSKRIMLENASLLTFNNRTSQSERGVGYFTLQELETLCKALNITGFINSGTLLGSWRHHDIIPWDDDFDYSVHISTKKELMRALDHSETLHYTECYSTYVKVWSQQETQFINKSDTPWRFPSVDVFFYSDCGDNVCFGYVFDFLNISKSEIFPTYKRPFGPLFLSAPKNSELVLHLSYDGFRQGTCNSCGYFHRVEEHCNECSQVPCDIIRQYFPFVYRTYSENKKIMTESLFINTTIFQALRYHIHY